MNGMLEAVPEPDSSLRDAPRTGPRPLFEDLYRGSRDDLYAYVAGLLRDRVVAEDVTALAFERAFRKWDRFDPKRGSARGWLFGIARNAALDELRKRKREVPAIEPDGLEARGSVAGTSIPVEESVVAREQRADLFAALGTLSPADREMVALKFFAGLNNVEVAEATGYSPTNVGTRLSRAMTRLRSELKTIGFAETDGSASSEEVAK
jgi:RNA polymerase sigma-70 factor (ECF subfamily)